MTNQIYRELEKNQMDKVAAEAELDNAKKRFANELVNEYSVYDITSFIYNKPQKFKKPLGMRIKRRFKRFIWNLLNVLGN
jgi:hypothetical protein